MNFLKNNSNYKKQMKFLIWFADLVLRFVKIFKGKDDLT